MAQPRGLDLERRGARALAIAGVLGALCLGTGLACNGSSGELMNSTGDEPPEVPPWACVPGETQPCPCDEDLEGLMTCDARGSGFGECDCSPGAVSQGPPPTSTGTESGTGTDTEASGSTTVDPSTGGSSSSGEPDPTTSGGSSSGAPDPTTSGGSSSSSTGGV